MNIEGEYMDESKAIQISDNDRNWDPYGIVKTGIKTLDTLFAEGGYPKNDAILVMGGPGCGKTIFGLQYVYKGALDYDEPGIFLALQERPEKLKRVMKSFGWEVDALERNNKLKFIDATTPRIRNSDIERDIMERGFDIDTIFRYLADTVKSMGAKRVVIDSLSMMSLYAETDFQTRTKLLSISSILSDLDITSLIISEVYSPDNALPAFTPEAFMFDGLVHLSLDPTSQLRRIGIRKMRGAKHAIGTFCFEIAGEAGIVIKA